MSKAKHGTVVPRTRKVAQRQIARHGLEGFTLRQIAKDADTSTSQLCKYFKTKDGLIADIFSEGWKLLDDVIQDSLNTVYSKDFDPIHAVKTIISNIFKTFEENQDAISSTVLIGYMVSPPLRDTMKKTDGFVLYQKLVKQFAKTCQNKISDEEAEIFTEIIYSTLMRLLYTLTPYYNSKKLFKYEIQEKTELLENILFQLVDGLIPKETPPHDRTKDGIAKKLVTLLKKKK